MDTRLRSGNGHPKCSSGLGLPPTPAASLLGGRISKGNRECSRQIYRQIRAKGEHAWERPAGSHQDQGRPLDAHPTAGLRATALQMQGMSRIQTLCK